MLRDQDQGAREAKRVRPAVKIVDIGYRGSLGFVGQDFTMKRENGNKAALKSIKRALVHSKTGRNPWRGALWTLLRNCLNLRRKRRDHGYENWKDKDRRIGKNSLIARKSVMRLQKA